MSANAPAAISATFCGMRTVASRKVAQITMEVPIEQMGTVLTVLGPPSGIDPQWVAIALLDVRAAEGAASKHPDDGVKPPRERKAWHDYAWSQQAAICCNDQKFRQFLLEKDMLKPDALQDEKAAATAVRLICGVNTRADIKSGTPAGDKWRDLHGKYKAWEIAS